MHTGARARKQKYLCIYISLYMKTFLKMGVYIYIYICNPWLVMCAKQCQDQSLVSTVVWAIRLVAPKGKG